MNIKCLLVLFITHILFSSQAYCFRVDDPLSKDISTWKKYKNEAMSVWGYVGGGAGGIEKVEVSFDDGESWGPAELKLKPKKEL